MKVSHSYRKKPQIWVIYSRNHTSKIFGCLKKINSFGNSATFFTLVIEKMGLYADITKENIGYGKLTQDVEYEKLIKNT